MPDFSIITICHNSSATIAETMRSVAGQKGVTLRHIVKDAGSIDGTTNVAICANPDAQIIVSSDSGIYDAMNQGLAAADGNIIGFLNSDDSYTGPNVLSSVLHEFAKGDVDGVYGDLEYVSKEDPRRVVRYWSAGTYSPKLLTRGWMPPTPTLFVRREFFNEFGAYNNSFRISGDYDAILRWLTIGRMRLAYVPDVLVRMRLGGESNRSLGRVVLKSYEDYRALRRNHVGGLSVLAAKNLVKLRQFVQRKQVPLGDE